MTDWNKIEDTFETIDNELSSVLCDAYDLKNFLKVQKWLMYQKTMTAQSFLLLIVLKV